MSSGKRSFVRPGSLPGSEIRQLLMRYGLTGNDAADLAAYYLGYSRQTVQAMFGRTIRRNDFDLLSVRLAEFFNAAQERTPSPEKLPIEEIPDRK